MDIFTFHFVWLPNLLLVALFLLSFSILKQKYKSIRPKLPPSPPGLPVLGNLHQLGELTHRSLWLLSKKYGPLMYLKLGQFPTIVVSSAKMAREILKIHDQECCNRPAFTSWVKYSYDLLDMAFSPHSEHWKEMRKICFHEILNVKRVESYCYIREEEVARMIETISLSCGRSSEPVNMSTEILSFFYHVICRILFSRNYEAENESEKAKIHGIFDEGRNLLGGFFVGDYFPLLWWLDVVSGARGRLRKSFLQYDSLYDRFIEDHLDPKNPKPEKEDFLDVLLQLQTESNLSRDNIKAVLMEYNMFMGATDGSAAIVTWGMLELMRNPRAMKKVQEEIRRVAGKKGKVEEADLPELTYLKLVVKEILRLHPPLIPRETLKHFKIGEFDVLPKTRILVNAWAVMRDPEYWEDPDEFIPERFMDSSLESKGHEYEYIPFGSGRRGCPGVNFAYMTLNLSLANLLYFFNWELPKGMKKEDMDISEKPGLTVVPNNPALLVPIKYDFMQKNG